MSIIPHSSNKMSWLIPQRTQTIPFHQKEKRKCIHRINEVALMCACCIAAKPECTSIPRTLNYKEHSFRVHCLDCKKQLSVIITEWGETVSYTVFDWVVVYSENPIPVENRWYPKKMLDEAKICFT